jgi:hypothetical protein
VYYLASDTGIEVVWQRWNRESIDTETDILELLVLRGSPTREQTHGIE